MRKDHLDVFGALLLFGVTVLLASNQILMKLTAVGIQPVFMAGARSLLAVLCLYIWMAWKGRAPRNLGADIGPGIAIGLVFAAEFLFLFLAVDRTSVGHVAILFYSMPVWFALLAHFFLGERLTWMRSAGLALAFSGAAVVILARSGGDQHSTLTGDIFALFAAFGWAGSAFLARATRLRQAGPEMQLFWMVLISAPILILASLGFGPLLRDIQPIHWAMLLFQGSVVATGGFIAWLWLLQSYPSSTVASFSFLSPVIAVLLGVLIFHEPLTISLAVASVLVAAGIVLINRRA